MAQNARLLAGINPAEVFDVLRDGTTYAEWVVGTRKIRAVDPGWPAPGKAIHYTVGYGPLRHDDRTVSQDYYPDNTLELEARAWPAGTVGIVLSARAVEGGTEVTIAEAPRRGLAKRVHNPVFDLLIKVRNVETLRRLEDQVRKKAATRSA